MKNWMKQPLIAALGAVLLCAHAPAQKGNKSAKDDPAAQQQEERKDVQKALSKKQFSAVKWEIGSDGTVTLSGQVERMSDKLDAEHRITRMHVGVQNHIEVAAEPVPDRELYMKLAKGLAYDRQGYGTLPFNAVDIAVKNGVVAIRGTVVTPTDKDSAMGLIANTLGVKDIVDQLKVAPVSPNDDRIRRAEFQSIYGYPQLNRYALDPVKPIRIVVLNGHVTLEGSVDTKADADVANIRANGVPGVFSVENHLAYGGGKESMSGSSSSSSGK